jgi:hypothetical protein
MVTTSTPPPGQHLDAVTKPLHWTFRYVLALLRMLLAINESTGFLSLSLNGSTPKIEDLTSRQKFTDAMTTILVLNHEVVAAVPLYSDEQETLIVDNRTSSSDDKPNVGGENDLIANHLSCLFQVGDTSQPLSHDQETDYDTSTATQFARVANPRDTYGASGAIYLIHEKYDFWPKCRTNDFTELLTAQE